MKFNIRIALNLYAAPGERLPRIKPSCKALISKLIAQDEVKQFAS